MHKAAMTILVLAGLLETEAYEAVSYIQDFAEDFPDCKDALGLALKAGEWHREVLKAECLDGSPKPQELRRATTALLRLQGVTKCLRQFTSNTINNRKGVES